MKQTRRARMVNETKMKVNKDYYTIEKLVFDITGLSKDDMSYEGEKRNIRSMINILGIFLNSSKEDLGIKNNQVRIPTESYEKYLDFYSRVYKSNINGVSMQSIMNKYNKGQEPTNDDLREIAIVFGELVKDEYQNDLVGQIIIPWIEDRIKTQYVEKARETYDEISNAVEYDLQRISLIFSPEKQVKALMLYKIYFNQVRDQVMNFIEEVIEEGAVDRQFFDMLLFPKEKRKIEDIVVVRDILMKMVEAEDIQSQNIIRFFEDLIERNR
ncbi:hypothetical protein [Turicibacter sanguinis]|jgi:hypothetical protein|uniref:hypothetical protein n=1 Tax=Turicibacter sanguinis TaxID=154288 RepID=UPI00325AF12B